MNHKQRNQDLTLYIGNLDEKVTEATLYELFIQVSPINSIHLPKDRVLRTHQGYGFIELKNQKDVEYAEKILQGTRLFGKNIKINKVSSKQDNQLNLGSTIFIKNLDPLCDESTLIPIFKHFGEFTKNPEIIRDENGNSKGYAFIYFKKFKDSDEAIKKMSGQFILNKQVYIEYAKKKGENAKHGDETERLLQQQAEINNYAI